MTTTTVYTSKFNELTNEFDVLKNGKLTDMSFYADVDLNRTLNELNN